MAKIDTKEWQPFHLDDIFDISMGNKFDRSKMTQNASVINFVGRSGQNNGVACEVDLVKDKNGTFICPYKAGDITIAMGGSIGSAFVQEKDFYTSQNVCVLHTDNPKITIHAKRFITTLITASCYNYEAFVEELNKHIKTDFTIYLPVQSEGCPDFAYMEAYMRRQEELVSTSLTALQSVQNAERKKINTRAWGDFVVGDLFDIHPTKAYKLTNAELLDNGPNPVVVNSAYNNGIGGYSSKPTTEKGNMITFSDTVDANTIFYQPKDFVGYPHVQGLYPIGKYADKWTPQCLMFFATIFRQEALARGFDYGNKFRRDIAKEMVVKLPDDIYGNPDWTYMEQCIKQIEGEAKSKIDVMIKNQMGGNSGEL